MNNPALGAIERQYARAYPVSYLFAQARVRKAVSGWVREMKEWMAAYPANAPEMAKWGLTAGQAAYCRLAWDYQVRYSRFKGFTPLRKAVYDWAMMDQYGFIAFHNVPLREQLNRSYIDTLLKAGSGAGRPLSLLPTCVIAKPIYDGHYLTRSGVRELFREGAVVIGDTVWRISEKSAEQWKAQDVVVLGKVVSPEDEAWEAECERRSYFIQNDWDERPKASSVLFEVYDFREGVEVISRQVPSISLDHIESRFFEIGERFAAYIEDCRERLEAEAPVGLSPWEIRFGEMKQEVHHVIKWADQCFAPEVLLFQGQQLILLRLPLNGRASRFSYIIPRDVLHATVDDVTLHIECRGHRSITWSLPDWKRAKELQDNIERHRIPPRHEHRQSNRSWR